jgi:hypothetical protein
MDRAAPVARKARVTLEASLEKALTAAEAKASSAFRAGDEAAGQAALNAHAVAAGASATAAWRELWQQLMVSFIDGVSKKPASGGEEDCGCSLERTSYSEEWCEKVVADAGEHYIVPNQPLAHAALHSKPAISKLAIKGVVQ